MKWLNKTLLQKEWMENRILLVEVIGIGLILRLMMGYMESLPIVTTEIKPESIEAIAQMIGLVLGWMYALILGLGMFASEYVGKTLSYLVTRPLSRNEILGTKWFLGMVELLVAMLALAALNRFYNGLDIPRFDGIPLEVSSVAFLGYLFLLGLMFFLMGGFVSILGKDLTRVSFLTIGMAVLLMSFLLQMNENGIAWKYPFYTLFSIVLFFALIFAGFSFLLFRRPANH